VIALVILPSLALVGFILWALCAETPALVCRKVDEDEPHGPIEWGPADEF
jgi:hypothetical protein